VGWRASAAVVAGVLVLGGLVVVLWLLRQGSVHSTAEQSPASPSNSRPPLAQSDRGPASAYSVPRSSGYFTLTVEPTAGDRFSVDVQDGGMATVSRPGGDKLGLTPVFRGGQLQLIIFRLFRRSPNASESAHQLAVIPLRLGSLSRFDAGASQLGVTWTDGQAPTPATTTPQHTTSPCCVACGNATVCALGVASECGRCGLLADRVRPSDR
jgi:hypothetical protein